jgi:hypothetical protein
MRIYVCASVRPIIGEPTNSVTDLLIEIKVESSIHRRPERPWEYTWDQGLGPNVIPAVFSPGSRT